MFGEGTLATMGLKLLAGRDFNADEYKSNDELSKIADNQEQVADANRLAERSFESLKSEQQQLLSIMKSLNDRAAKLDA